MKDSNNILSLQTLKEEIFNGISHGIGTIIATIGLGFLIVRGLSHNAKWSLTSMSIYGLCLITLFAISSLYHLCRRPKIKNILRILDHSSIYLLIAGTYTPISLIIIGGQTGWIFFCVQWTLAAIGITLKLFYTGKYETLSLIMYVVMGWMAILKIDVLTERLSEPGFGLLLGGGIVYTLGILFYVLDSKLKFSHFIWHLFVIVASTLHYVLISNFI